MHWTHTHARYVLVIALALVAVAVALLVQHDTTQNRTEALQGSGVSVSDHRGVSAFSSLVLAGANDVTVNVGGEQAVVVRGDSNLVPLVSTEVDSGTLVIGNHGSFKTRAPMSVTVTVPALTNVTLKGDGEITVTGVQGDALAVSLPGTGNLVVAGSASRVDVSLSGTGQIDASRLASMDADAQLAGTGQIVVHAAHSLRARLGGTGAIYYAGHPVLVDKSVTGTGVIAAS
jgi:hypothetical protein